ncbi:MAG: hypothetical protein Q7T54_03320 [Candidatus Levybacteria bacterium]|nr:hypothetical protein [Candidatus Levybacteria bacterium]
MSRRRIIKEAREEIIEDAEVVMRWSSKRIVIATFLVVMIIFGGIYAISLLSQNPSRVLGEKTADQPKIKIPTERTVEDVIEKAKEDLSNINAKNIISSQPKLQQIINDLTNLTGSSTSAKDLICNTVCK